MDGNAHNRVYGCIALPCIVVHALSLREDLLYRAEEVRSTRPLVLPTRGRPKSWPLGPLPLALAGLPGWGFNGQTRWRSWLLTSWVSVQSTPRTVE